MISRRGFIACTALAVIALIALLTAGLRNVQRREVVLRAPDAAQVAQLRPSQYVCEGPVTAQAQIQSVGIWGSPLTGLSKLRVDVQDASTRRSLATGQIAATAPGENVARLDRAAPGGRPLTVCVIGNLNTFSLLGSPAQDPNVVMSGKTPGLEFSLVLLNDRHSLLSSLATAFSRASLFRPSWVGAWTFWVLAAALLGAFGLGVMAVVTAASADEDARPPGGDEPDSDSPTGPDSADKDRFPSGAYG
jgi:hypothetical protein